MWRQVSRDVLLCALLAAAPDVYGEEGVSTGDQEPGAPVCDEFYDKWEVPGLPAAMLAMAGIGRELIAAQDCIEKNNAPMACRHWSKVLEVTDNLGAPFNQDRGGIEQMMREQQCDPNAEPATDPKAAPDSAE